jgi:hypothetical protein
VLSVISLIALVVAPAGLIQWRLQTARERRQRTVDLLLRYDEREMLSHRGLAWKFLQTLEGPTSTTTDGIWRRDDDVNGRTTDSEDQFGSVFVVLRFFDLLERLHRLGHLDPDLTEELFEEHRRAWEGAFRPLIAGTSHGQPHHALLQQITRPMTAR